LKIPRTTFAGYESNSKREPNFRTLILISDLLEVNLDYLIKGKDKEQQNNIFVDSQLVLSLGEMEKEFEMTQKVLDARKKEIQEMKKLINK
jgi:transcriptional regulator with XRE-family HTH domain